MVVEIEAQRSLMENPMQPFQRPDTTKGSEGPDTNSSPAVDAAYDDEAFPTLDAAHSAIYNSCAAIVDDGTVQIVAEADDEHDMLAMLRGMGRTVVHLEQELAEQYEALDAAEQEASEQTGVAPSRLTHCSFSVPVVSGAQAGKSIDAVVLAKVQYN